MGYGIKLQKVQRPTSKSFYVNLPSAIAEAMNLAKGEDFYWEIEDKNTLILHRTEKIPPRKSSGKSGTGNCAERH